MQVKGYQQGQIIAFTPKGVSIYYYYIDGVSITVGNSRKHVWTCASGASDDHQDSAADNNCPCTCAAAPGPDSSAFVGRGGSRIF